VDIILAGFEKVYGRDRIKERIEELEKGEGGSLRDFDSEEVISISR
jgi:hypothetical protein